MNKLEAQNGPEAINYSQLDKVSLAFLVHQGDLTATVEWDRRKSAEANDANSKETSESE